MIFGEDRQAIRMAYRDAWRKRCEQQVLSPLEAQIADVIDEHPEFQALLSASEADIDANFPGVNPFLHMGLHLAVRDQVKMDRPAGIRAIFADLLRRHGNPHDAEHRMFDALGETLAEAQQRGAADEARYLERLRRLD